MSEAYCADRRCAVIGPGLCEIPHGLLRAGARSVHHYASDRDRQSVPVRLDRTLLVRDLPAGEFDVREGAFDLVVVDELAALGDPSAWLGRFRRLLGASGVLVLGATRATGQHPSDDEGAFSLHELAELLSVQFAWIDLRGLASFHGMLVAPIGAPGGLGEFLVHPLETSRAVVESFLAIASQKPRAPEPALLLEVPAELAAMARVYTAPTAGDGPSEAAVSEVREALAAADLAANKLREERSDLRDTIDLRETALRASETQNDRFRVEIEALTAHLDRALAGAVPAHLQRLEALAGKDRPRVIESPMALAERARFIEEIAAADAARVEADDACLRLETRLHTSEVARKNVEREAAIQLDGADDLRAHAALLNEALAEFEVMSAAEIMDRESRLRDVTSELATLRRGQREFQRWLRADSWRVRPGAVLASPSLAADEGGLVRGLLESRARADILSVEIQALRARVRRIVEAVDEAASSSIDMGESAPTLAGISPTEAALSLLEFAGMNNDDGRKA